MTQTQTDTSVQAAQWFSRLQSEGATDEDRCAFQAWLDVSPTNRQAYERLALIWQNAPAGLSVERSIPESAPPPASFRAHRGLVLGGLGAAAAALAIVGFLILSKTGFPTYSVGLGEHLAVALPDASVIDLNTSTTVEIHTSKKAREVRLVAGEAFFTVSPDRRRPFLVTTAKGITARAVGTQFAVRDGGGAVSLAVLSGTVEIFRDGAAPGAATPVLVGAGQAIDYPSTGQPGAVRAARVNDMTAWREGKIVFEDATLEDALAQINRYQRQKIEIMDAPLRALRVGGVFGTHRGYELVRQLAKAGYVRVAEAPDGTVRLYRP